MTAPEPAEDKQRARLEAWQAAADRSFDTPAIAALYRQRTRRFVDIVSLRQPDRVPCVMSAAGIITRYAGNQFADSFYDLNPFPGPLALGPITFSQNDLWVVTVGWSLVAISSLAIWSLMRSPWGRVLKGIREDEDAVRSLGKNVYSYKMQALILGGVIGSLGGFVSAIAYTILILGGAARVFGPIVGAMIFWGLLVFVGESLNEAVSKGVITFITTTQVGQIRFMLVGLGLMMLMIFRPQGIFGDRKELALDAR